jgi:PAS domain S-box-containing protein
VNREAQETIRDLSEAISDLLAGKEPRALCLRPTEDPVVNQLCEAVIGLVNSLNEANRFINCLSQGDLTIDVPTHNFLVSPFKQLHSNLRHLTWQAQQIASGDLNQKVDFLGEFSDAFNSMIESLRAKRKTEEALKESEERFRQITAAIQDVFWLVDGSDPPRFIYVSPAVERMLGLSPQELYDNPGTWMELVHPEDRPRLSELLHNCLCQGEEYGIEYRIIRRDQSVCWVWSRCFAIRGERGETYRAAGITHDITQRKLDQQEQQRLHEEIRELVYIISHDLRAPLVNLQGFSSELKVSLALVAPVIEQALPELSIQKRSEIETTLNLDIPEALEFIGLSVSRMDDLVKSILKLSRSGHRLLEFETLDMSELVEKVVGSFAHQIETRGIQISIDPLPEVYGDRIAMEQIVGNLLDNAIKYLVPERPGKIEITGGRGLHETSFRIKDNGRGISEDDSDRIFALFQRAGEQHVEGEGMGLTHVRTLVRRHRGRIWCESKTGLGSTFTFTIANVSDSRVV